MIAQCRIVANTYSGTDRTDLVDHLDTRTNTRKPMTALNPKQRRIILEVAPAQVERLNKNQRTIVKALLKKGEVTVAELAKRLKVTPQAIRKDMAKLQEMDMVEKRGSGRSTYYALKESDA